MVADVVPPVRLALAGAERLLGKPLIQEPTDPATGEITPIKLVTGHGPAFTAAEPARFVASRPELVHVRTRCKSPGQNGVRERGFESLEYERLHRTEISDGPVFAEQAEDHQRISDRIRQ